MRSIESVEADVRLVIANYPTLTSGGMGGDGPPVDVAEVARAIGWIDKHMAGRRNVNRRHSSYWLKHLAEGDIGHVSNGAFIAAAISASYKFRAVGVNCYFGMREEFIRAAEVRQERAGTRIYA